MAGTAIFDLDRTVTRAPTWARFVLYANGTHPRFWARVPGLVAHGIFYKMGLSNRDAVKAHALKSLAWMDRATLEAKAEAFVAREVASGLRSGARAAPAPRRARGHRPPPCAGGSADPCHRHRRHHRRAAGPRAGLSRGAGDPAGLDPG